MDRRAGLHCSTRAASKNTATLSMRMGVTDSDLPCRFRPEQFPHIENYVINTYRNRDPFRMVVGDPDAIEDAFASIFNE
ncbi:hypothetical protein [Xanthomonas melonis]|uniref:hypothetical protein n=1 Tax=Xanthomonas melonis TaxID=56456 RepID=UPI003EBB6ECB